MGETPVHLLAKARSRKTNSDHPMAFTLTYGKGRVFHTPLGHDVRSIRDARRRQPDPPRLPVGGRR